MRDVVWSVSHARITGAERCLLERTASGWRFSGTVVASYDGRPLDVGYDVELDDDWVTRRVVVQADRVAGTRGLELEHASDGHWTVDGSARPELDGCTDVDLGVSPSTNTLPIRRLGLAVGDVADVRVAWVRFPALEVDAGSQRYERLASDVWRYSSGGFSADLVVDEDGLAVRYGDDLWQMLAG